MKKLIKIADFIWRSLAINPGDDWIWYEVSKTLSTQMGDSLQFGLTQADRHKFNSLN